MWWFGSEIPVLHPLPACPCSQLPPAEQRSLEVLTFAWSNSIFASNSVQSQILLFRGWSKVGTHPGWGFGAALLQTGKSEGKSQEKGGKDPEGISTLCTQLMWSVLKAGPVQAAISTTLPPDLVQSLPLEDFIWNCSPWQQGVLAAECVGILGSTRWGNVSEGGAGSARLWLKE